MNWVNFAYNIVILYEWFIPFISETTALFSTFSKSKFSLHQEYITVTVSVIFFDTFENEELDILIKESSAYCVADPKLILCSI